MDKKIIITFLSAYFSPFGLFVKLLLAVPSNEQKRERKRKRPKRVVYFPVKLFASPNVCECVYNYKDSNLSSYNLRIIFFPFAAEKWKEENCSTLAHTEHSHNIFKNQ